MAIADDFTVGVNGDIRHSANTNHYEVLDLHRFLQGLADDESPATPDDVVDITTATPSERSTDGIIKLLGSFNIDDDASEYFYGGSIKQGSGDTETLYSGLKILGAVNNSNSQLQVVQDNAYYNTTTPFWGDQSGGGYNGDEVSGVLLRILVKSREYGADINQKKIRLQARTWGDTYDFFDVTLGEGEAVGALGTTPDPQNSTAIGTVQGWGGGDIPTNVEGWQEIDIFNGDGVQPYYSKWTYDTNALGIRAIWEWIKELTGNDDPGTLHGAFNGEFFLGITHSFGFNNESGALTEDETLVWGTNVTYGTLAGGTFAEGDYVLFKNAGTLVNAGKVVYDNGSTNMIVALENVSGGTLADGYTIEEASAGTVTAVVSGVPTEQDKGGGEGKLWAYDPTSDNIYLQLIHGVAPVDTLEIRGITSVQTVDVNGSVTARTVPKVMLGSYTGSLIGAYGIGIDPDDLSSTDTIEDLGGVTRYPPNNVIFALSGLVAGDRVLVGNKDTGDVFEWAEMQIETGFDLNGPTETIVNVGTGNIPADAPATGILRISLDDGRIRRIAYTSHDGDDEFTIGSSDWQSPDDASAGQGVMLAFIDKVAGSDTEQFTLQFDAIRTLWIRVREGTSGTPMKTFESQATLNNTGGSAVASRIDDY